MSGNQSAEGNGVCSVVWEPGCNAVRVPGYCSGTRMSQLISGKQLIKLRERGVVRINNFLEL